MFVQCPFLPLRVYMQPAEKPSSDAQSAAPVGDRHSQITLTFNESLSAAAFGPGVDSDDTETPEAVASVDPTSEEE